MGWDDYESPEELEAAVEQYFSDCDQRGELYGEAGLMLALNVAPETLRNWYDGTERPEFQPVVQRAYLRIQHQIESGQAYQERGMMTRAAFLLKQRRLGGYQEHADKAVPRVEVRMGKNTEPSDFA